MYQIIGSDGKMYGPASAETIREWIASGRADSRTHVLTEGGSAWTTLGLLPEFLNAFSKAPPTIAPQWMPSAGVGGTNGLAITGFVCGLVSFCGCFCCLVLPVGVLGLVFSLVGLSQIKSSNGVQDGRGLAIAGLILSVLGLLGGVGFLFFNLLSAPAPSLN